MVGGRLRGSPSTPFGLTARHAVGAQLVDEVDDRFGSCRPRLASCGPGTGQARASSTSPIRRRGHRRCGCVATMPDTWRPSPSSLLTARCTGRRCPPWPLTNTTPADQSALRTSSTITCSTSSAPIDRVPGKASVLAAGGGRQRRTDQHIAGLERRDQPSGERGGDTRVGVERQMWAVLFARPDRHSDDRSRGHVPQIRPRDVAETGRSREAAPIRPGLEDALGGVIGAARGASPRLR